MFQVFSPYLCCYFCLTLMCSMANHDDDDEIVLLNRESQGNQVWTEKMEHR